MGGTEARRSKPTERAAAAAASVSTFLLSFHRASKKFFPLVLLPNPPDPKFKAVEKGPLFPSSLSDEVFPSFLGSQEASLTGRKK